MFEKYQHIERIGNREVEGLLEGKVYIYPKLDGTNGVVWWEGGKVHFGSRNHGLGEGADNHGFKAALATETRFEGFFAKHPHTRIYGEWLVPHTLKTYKEDAWRKFYVFDVKETIYGEQEDPERPTTPPRERYLPYEEYAPMLEEVCAAPSMVVVIPPLGIVDRPKVEDLQKYLDENIYLMAGGVGEGIVCKRYDFVNKYGVTKWGKIVRGREEEVAKAAARKALAQTEADIAERWVKIEDIEKDLQKVLDVEHPEWTKPMIPKLLGIYWHTFVTENVWEIIKKHPKVDFNVLRKEVIERVKMVKRELFV